MVAEPTPAPVTEPKAFTDAIDPFELDQVPPVIVFANNVDAPEQTLFAPVIEGTTGKAVTVTVVGVDVAVQPFASVIVYA